MGQQSFLPEIDRKRTQAAVEDALEKYRIYKYLYIIEERESSTTAAYSDMPRSSPTNVTSDQTANIAVHNVDSQAYREEYCKRVERAVKRMPRMESFLIESRYMTKEHDYITDYYVYNFAFQPPMSGGKYATIRWKAFYKFASIMNLLVEKEQRKGGNNERN